MTATPSAADVSYYHTKTATKNAHHSGKSCRSRWESHSGWCGIICAGGD